MTINDTGLLSVTIGRLESELAELFGGVDCVWMEGCWKIPLNNPGGLGIVRYSYCTALPASAQPQNLPPWFKRLDRSDFNELSTVHLRPVKNQYHALASYPDHKTSLHVPRITIAMSSRKTKAKKTSILPVKEGHGL